MCRDRSELEFWIDVDHQQGMCWPSRWEFKQTSVDGTDVGRVLGKRPVSETLSQLICIACLILFSNLLHFANSHHGGGSGALIGSCFLLFAAFAAVCCRSCCYLLFAVVTSGLEWVSRTCGASPLPARRGFLFTSSGINCAEGSLEACVIVCWPSSFFG